MRNRDGARVPHVCVFTTAHPTDDVRVNTRMASAFHEAGYRVSWVGPERAYFSESVRVAPHVDYHLFRPNSSRGRRLTAGFAASRAAREVHDVDWWYCPDPDAAAKAVDVARRQGGRVLFDIHEVFHEGLLDRWFPGKPPLAVREVVRRRLARTCQRVDLVTGVSRSVVRPYLQADETTLITRNCAPRMFGVEKQPDRAGDGRLKVMHGKAIPSNGTLRVLDALALLPPDVGASIQVHFTRMRSGDAFSALVDGKRQALPDPRTCVLEDAVPHEQMPELLFAQNVGMVAYQRDLGVDSLPNRLFEYMASGLAILAPSYATEIVSILEAEQIGVTADFEDDRDVARALTWLSHHPDEVAAMGERARRAFHERHNWDTEATRMIEKMRSMES